MWVLWERVAPLWATNSVGITCFSEHSFPLATRAKSDPLGKVQWQAFYRGVWDVRKRPGGDARLDRRLAARSIRSLSGESDQAWRTAAHKPRRCDLSGETLRSALRSPSGLAPRNTSGTRALRLHLR
jgi:hypothetical protein